jgi:hypothetical protein
MMTVASVATLLPFIKGLGGDPNIALQSVF